MYTVMVTGGIGSGKSALVESLCKHGAVSIDLDEINRTLLSSNQSMICELSERFGHDILDENGAIIPSLLAERAFENRETVQAINAISFPYITDMASDYILDVHCTPRTTSKVLAVEVPLLNEVPEFAELADEVIAVCAPSDIRLARAVKRGMDASDVIARMELQATDAERSTIADTVFHNIGTRKELDEWVDLWWSEHQSIIEKRVDRG